MRVLNRLIFVLVFFWFTSMSAFAGGAERSLALESLRWYDCVDRDECLALSKKFSAMLKKDYKPAVAAAAALSALLAEHLRDAGMHLNLDVIEEADNLKRASGGDIAPLIEGVKTAVIGGWVEGVLKGRFVPFVMLRKGRDLVDGGRSEEAGDYLNNLVGRYPHKGEVVSLWARAEMECGRYPERLYKRLMRVYRENPSDLSVVAQMIRFLNHRSRPDEIRKLTSRADATSPAGRGGSEFFMEWGRFEMSAGRRRTAESHLTRAIALDPKNLTAYRLLGKLYLTDKKDIPKAIASLKSYIQLAPGRHDTEEIKSLIINLEKEQKL